MMGWTLDFELWSRAGELASEPPPHDHLHPRSYNHKRNAQPNYLPMHHLRCVAPEQALRSSPQLKGGREEGYPALVIQFMG
jgi:hypothetical protein